MCISHKPAFLGCCDKILKLFNFLSTATSWKWWEEDKVPDKLVTRSGIYFMLKEGAKDRDKRELFSKSFESLLFLSFQLLEGTRQSNRDQSTGNFPALSGSTHQGTESSFASFVKIMESKEIGGPSNLKPRDNQISSVLLSTVSSSWQTHCPHLPAHFCFSLEVSSASSSHSSHTTNKCLWN